MQCQICKKNEATVHLTKVADGKVQQIADLCPECAAANGLNESAPISLEAMVPLLKAPETAS